MKQPKLKLEEAIAYGSRDAIIQNLKDAGCNQDMIDYCINCLDSCQKEGLLKRLENHRLGLLEKIHEGQKQIDCLDYLIYQINRCFMDVIKEKQKYEINRKSKF